MPKCRVNHPIFARFYARMSGAMERGGIAEHRDTLLAGLTGQVIEVGAGNGMYSWARRRSCAVPTTSPGSGTWTAEG
jgi:hypothetical protein